MLNADGTFGYIHDGGTTTFDTFEYRAVDEHGAVSQQIVTVVISIEDAPPAEWQNPILRWDVNNDGRTEVVLASGCPRYTMPYLLLADPSTNPLHTANPCRSMQNRPMNWLPGRLLP